MTATLLSFPTLLERDEAEFDRFRTSSYTRALDNAVALWEAVSVVRNRAELRERIESFAAQLAPLAVHRPECFANEVMLSDGQSFPLSEMPRRLRAALGPVGEND